jgi:peptidylprolyl isomerase
VLGQDCFESLAHASIFVLCSEQFNIKGELRKIMKFKAMYLILLGLMVVGCNSVQQAATEAPAAPTATPVVAEAPATEAPATVDPTPEATEPAAEASSESQINEEDVITTDSGLKYVVIEEGTGATPKAGELVKVHYTGTLADGTKFDSSLDRGEPIQFVLGRGQVIPGWDEGIGLMKVGGKCKLIIPPDLAYGEQGAGGVIPPNATLNFEVELVAVEEGPPPPPEAPTEVGEADFTTTDSGLKYYDLEAGSGDSPKEGQMATVHYTGWLEDGTMFDSSLTRGEPFNFPIGAGQVIPGWDEGVASMKVGGKRQLVIPADLGYGDQGAGGVIPPNATLIFEVELLGVE